MGRKFPFLLHDALERAVDRLPVAVHADIALEVDEVESFGRPGVLLHRAPE